MAKYTTNLHLEKPEYNETADIEIINQNMEKIDSEMTYKTATGTGTEIKLSLPETFGNGYNTTFIASANNGAAATTVNGKPLYKPNTTTPPNITSGKAYSIWYNAPGDCFFLKASAEGDADVSHVLATKKFSNDNDTGLVGTMPERGNVTANLNAGQSYTIPEGHHGGGGKITANSLASQTQGTAQAGHILSGKDAYVNGKKVTGNMPNRGRHQVALNQYMYTHTDGKTYLVNWIPGGYCEGWQNSNGTLCTESWIEQSKVASALGITPNKIVSGQEIAGIWGSATAQNLLKYASGTINGEQTINFGFNILVVYIGDPNCFDLPLRTSSSFAAYVNFNGTLLRGGEAGAYTSGGHAYVDYTMPITVSGTSITCTASKYYSRNYYVIGY